MGARRRPLEWKIRPRARMAAAVKIGGRFELDP
jgi:hypothetical protein